MKPVGGIRGWARATLQAAGRLYGRDSYESGAVRQAWAGVGVENLRDA